MTDMNVNEVLAQMRAMSIEAGSKPQQNDSDFAAILKQSIDTVNETQKASGELSKAFETGDSDVSLAEVMIASQKASVSFQAMVQVRNKLVEAYQDVMNMPM
ncbi:flagellar hook-basal body complex protein FliE [Methylomarinum sp. Ch1-1]|uniref:Flagellar hook-basal body complex protein FliE n=1 Tax=Methylomarinum roseum TaxID=3067653 RepID=A0AAU7NUJ6_9GAMM|nr:flagellar hook-basal body complex protein FliE [Methylomarinum sp. Ch1-1]MDP4519622.1 flagellar hook-basal body complex protein FliE [Methylomarinum sp. Ch1-1]